MFSSRALIIFYWLVVLVYLLADASSMFWLTYITKPALVSILLIYFVWSVQPKFNRFALAIIAGLVFAIAGDSFLLANGDGYFMLGLGSFLLTHVFYAIAFFGAAPNLCSQIFSTRKIPLVLFLLLLVTLLAYLWPDLGGLRWPVLFYGTAITVMGFSAFNLKDVVSEKVFLLLFIGALLFIFSDTMIAIDKFKSGQLNLPFPRLLIMIPYVLAQYLIVEGSVALSKR